MRNRLFFLIILFSLIPSWAGAWDDKKTHPALTLEAIDRATDLKDALKSQLGLEGEIKEKLYNGKNHTYSITKWLMEGSHLEDVPDCRAANHFHNPWKPWENSMLTDQTWFTDNWCSSFYSQFSSQLLEIKGVRLD